MVVFAILGCLAFSFIVVIIPCLWGVAIGKNEDEGVIDCGYILTAVVYTIVACLLIDQFVF